MIKRLFDIIASFLGLIILSPVFLIISFLILGRMGRPIFFLQKRTGRYGRPFTIYKFRTMTTDHSGSTVSVRGESRITPLGAVLRKYKLDELPELFNVFIGDMSFVGPRPERPQFVAELAKKLPFYTMRHMVKPGITGWAQICFPYGASEEDAREKLEYDLYYIKNYSIFFDTVILLQTVHTVFWGKGAH